MAYSNSRTWVSPTEGTRERWASIRSGLIRMRFIDRSPVVPRDLQQFIDHEIKYTEKMRDELNKTIFWSSQRSQNSHRKLDRKTPRPALRWILNGELFNDNRSAVLAYESTWAPWFTPTCGRPLAPWPSSEEFKEEGDERNTSGFKRFLPRPRVPGNETVVWKQKAFLEPFPLDYVEPVPIRESTRAKREHAILLGPVGWQPSDDISGFSAEEKAVIDEREGVAAFRSFHYLDIDKYESIKPRQEFLVEETPSFMSGQSSSGIDAGTAYGQIHSVRGDIRPVQPDDGTSTVRASHVSDSNLVNGLGLHPSGSASGTVSTLRADVLQQFGQSLNNLTVEHNDGVLGNDRRQDLRMVRERFGVSHETFEYAVLGINAEGFGQFPSEELVQTPTAAGTIHSI